MLLEVVEIELRLSPLIAPHKYGGAIHPQHIDGVQRTELAVEIVLESDVVVWVGRGTDIVVGVGGGRSRHRHHSRRLSLQRHPSRRRDSLLLL